MKRLVTTAAVLCLGGALEAGSAAQDAPPPTRGIGVYPGDPREDFSPTLVLDAASDRNLALRRPAFHSSSYDYNLTAQLVTDGILPAGLPRTLSVSTSQRGTLPKHERELALDGSATSTIDFDAAGSWLQLELRGGQAPPRIDRVQLQVRTRRRPGSGAPPWLAAPGGAPGEWAWVVSASDDGRTWSEVGRASGRLEPAPPPPSSAEWPALFEWFRRANPTLRPELALTSPTRSRFYRVALASAGGEQWSLAEIAFFSEGRRVELGGPHDFTSAWMSAGLGDEWVSVDLGARCTVDRVTLHWVRRAAQGELQASDDGESWRRLQSLPENGGPRLIDEIALAEPVQTRWLRVLMTRPATKEGYVLGELEAFGRGGPVPRARPAPPPRADGRLDLAGGGWRLQRASLVSAEGATLSQPGFADGDWVVATVPGTVLASYHNAGAVPDPDFGANQLMISDSFFHSDFWYRTEFETAAPAAGRHAFLSFDGVNWKAEVFLNGSRLGRIEGAFTRGRFDITRLLRAGRNALAVRIEKNASPGSAKQKTIESPGLNGGALGADNPTYHASIGWDWIPTVRGRNIGIWNDVFLTTSGPATIEDPFVTTTLSLGEASRADVRISLQLANHEAAPVAGTLRGRFGEISFEQPLRLEAGARREFVLDPGTHPQLRLSQPRLWWPNGYGEPHLYDVSLELVTDAGVSDAKRFRAGVRQYTYSDEDGALRIFVNGRRLVPRGGNWGFPETNLRYRGREYDVAVRYHRDMNFTMIRNWVGQTADDEFYEACDRHGIVVWQDFWLANPFDGPDPDDEALFLANVRDTVVRLRNHASVGLYCGRNEGDPPPALDAGMRRAIAELHGEIRYIPHSAAGGVSGGGPYRALPPRYYFEERATPRLHSELGMPNVVRFESLRRMMPESALWPPGLEWALHDFTLGGAQSLATFRQMVEQDLGGADDVSEWVRLAQLVNYDGYRAMFEAQSKHRMGLLLWMSHPAWPSFVWQTYDYFFDPSAGYFGSRKGSEPLHIQWNPVSDAVEVVNYSAGSQTALRAEAELLNLDGAVVWRQAASVDSPEDSVRTPFAIEYPQGLTPVHFVRLRLRRGGALSDDTGGETVSENVYWRGLEERDLRALRALPRVALEARTRRELSGARYVLTTEVANPSPHPALLVRVSPVRGTSGDRILPALFSDNDVALMPGERRTITTTVEAADVRGEEPAIVVDGFNVVRARSD